MSCTHECGIEFANPDLIEMCQGEVLIAGAMVCRAAWTKLRQEPEVHLLKAPGLFEAKEEVILDLRENCRSQAEDGLMLIYGYK